MLEKINTPADMKELSAGERKILAEELRREIIKTVSKNGGHLASNLGIVELTVALHTVYDCPDDSIIFDVGHQCYAHKLLTGRRDSFGSLRQYGGISGFTNRDESIYDTVTAGHSGPSVSTALGIAAAKALKNDGSRTVAVLGDGSFTNGMIYEALNSCSGKKMHLTIILNDNGMSISRNVGGLSDYLSRIRTSEKYFNFKCFMKTTFIKIPLVGKLIVALARIIRDVTKRVLLNENIFESLGIEYIGPVNGEDTERLINVLEEAKSKDECAVIHVKTVKGNGYEPAEKSPDVYHSVAPFNPVTGEVTPACETFTSVVSKALCECGTEDEKVCAVCAAMPTGTGLDAFKEFFPNRFFDVGIAEEHAISFTAGLSVSGMKAVCVMYATFAQRVYDQIFHDASLQKVPMTLLLSHAGLVPGDGVTHQGLYDCAMFSSVPGVHIYMPDSYTELENVIKKSLISDTVDIIRYPKSTEAEYDRSAYSDDGIYHFRGSDRPDIIVTFGRLTALADRVACSEENIGVLRLSEITPLDGNKLFALLSDKRTVYILEEGIKRGGIAEGIASCLSERGYRGKVIIHAVENEFIPHGDLKSLFARCGFTEEEIIKRLSEF